ncbi:MAG TPA: enoyl-CoA hydratase/isomerase family protein [Steroidobacteraceae bacterium]|nr:enoyl-CoA hydratase/isomerase family protein [Steroidobacteraceae bacterium]
MTANSDLVLREDRHGAAILTLNRPEKLNALTKDMFEALDRHVEAIARDVKTVGLVIVRGAGGNFSGGYDMAEVLDYAKAHAKPHFHSEVIEKIADLPQPVVSAVQGHCSTGGMEVALAADLIFAAESAQFCDAYARWGLTPIWGLSLRLPHRIGTAKAAEMMLTCRTYSGVEAQAMHLANFCVPDERFEVELANLSQTILSHSWYSHRVNKHALRQSDGLPLHDAHALELFKEEGLAPDAVRRLERFGKPGRRQP